MNDFYDIKEYLMGLFAMIIPEESLQFSRLSWISICLALLVCASVYPAEKKFNLFMEKNQIQGLSNPQGFSQDGIRPNPVGLFCMEDNSPGFIYDLHFHWHDWHFDEIRYPRQDVFCPEAEYSNSLSEISILPERLDFLNFKQDQLARIVYNNFDSGFMFRIAELARRYPGIDELFKNENDMKRRFSKMVRRFHVRAINIDEDFDGIQIGFINIAEEMTGTPIGLINIAKNGEIKILSWSNTFTPLNIGVKFSVNRAYSILYFGGMNLENNINDSFTLGFHYGRVILGQNPEIEIDLGYQYMNNSGLYTDYTDSVDQHLVQLRAITGINLGSYRVFGGLGLGYSIENHPDCNITRIFNYQCNGKILPVLVAGIEKTL